MEIEVREVKTRQELKTYIYLPARIHRDHKNWVPPIYMDEWDYYNPKKNENFTHCDTVLYLAYRGEVAVGRIMGVISHKYNEAKGEKTGRWNYLEVYDDQDVAHALIAKAEDWARDRGMEKMIGPFSFSDKDPQGYLIDGYDQPIVIASHGNFPYLINIIEKEGYGKEVDLVVYKVNIPKEDPDLYKRISERTLRNNPDLKLLEFTSRKKLKPFVVPVLELLNKTFRDIYGFAPMSLKEMKEFASRYLILIHPRLVKVIVNQEHKPVAFVIAMEDISKGIKKCKVV